MRPNRFSQTFPFLPWHSWAGLTIILVGQVLFVFEIRFVAVWLTPIMWTGYILLIDGIVYRLRGTSWLTKRLREFPLLALVSIGVWLIFEAYNFHLKNWIYQGVPTNPILRDIAYFWSFSTIMPGVFETADLIETLIRRREPIKISVSENPDPGLAWLWFILGIAFLVFPLTLPSYIAQYLFGMVWIGFFLLLDPINELIRVPSLRAQWRGRDRDTGMALLLSGMVCGILWETWNYQAFLVGGGHWVYTVPQALRVFNLHFGKMPVFGLLGFPPFALELYAFYNLIRKMLGGSKIFGEIPHEVKSQL